MPIPPPPPIGRRCDPDLLLTDKLPQPFRMVQGELLRIVYNAVEIGCQNQQEEEERSRKPSTTADRTIGPLLEHDGLGAVASLGTHNCPRPFYARESGDIVEVGEDGSVGLIERPAQHAEGDTVQSMASTCRADGLEVLAVLSSTGNLFVWHRQAEAQSEVPDDGEIGVALAQMELRAAVAVAALPDLPEFTRCELSDDASVLVLSNQTVVAVYANPISFEQGAESVGALGKQLAVVQAPAETEMSPEVFPLSGPKPRTLTNDVLEEYVSSVLVLWLGTPYMDRVSLLEPLPGDPPPEEGVPAPPHVSRWVLTSDARTCALSRDRSLLATGLADGCTVLWDVASGTSKFVFELHVGAVEHVRLGPEHAVTVGADKKLRCYSLDTGRRLIEIDVPPCGIAALCCLQDAPLALAFTTWGLKLIDLSTGNIFADLSTTSPEVVPEVEGVQWHFGEALTVMATRPADPPAPPEEGEEPPPEEEPQEEPAPWRVPIQIEVRRILSTFQEYKLETSMSVVQQEEPMFTGNLGQASERPKRGTADSATTRGSHSHRQTNRGEQRQSLNFPNAGQSFLPTRPSPFDLANPSAFDMIGRVREYSHLRHGERRLRDIRVQKRLGTLLDSMREAEAGSPRR